MSDNIASLKVIIFINNYIRTGKQIINISNSIFKLMKPLYFLLCLMIITSCNNKETPEGKVFSVKQNDEFTVKLKSNATTGYKWFLTGELSVVDSMEQKYTGGSGGTGAGGMEYWTFRGKNIGTDTLKFKYQMTPEMQEVSRVRQFIVNVTE